MSSTNRLDNQEPIDNNMVLCTSKYIKRIDLMLNVLITPTQTHPQEHKEIRKSLEVWYVFSSSMMVMVSWAYTYVQTHQDVYIKCVHLLHQFTSVKSFLSKKENYNDNIQLFLQCSKIAWLK